MNKLLQTIKENDEEFDKFNKKFFGFFPYNGEDKHHYFWSDIQSHITQSRIKELEALVEMMEEPINEKEEARAWDIEDVIQLLQDTIKQLKTN